VHGNGSNLVTVVDRKSGLSAAPIPVNAQNAPPGWTRALIFQLKGHQVHTLRWKKRARKKKKKKKSFLRGTNGSPE